MHAYKHNIVKYEHVITSSEAVYCYLKMINMGIKNVSR